MGLLDKARTLESRIARALNRAAADAVGSGDREPLEIAHAIVDCVDQRVQSGSRGLRVFPFNHLAVTVVASSREARVRFETLFDAAPSLHDRIAGRLRRSGCDVGELRVDVGYATRTGRNWHHPQFHVAFDRITLEPAAAVSAVAGRTAPIECTVVRGTAERRSYSFSQPRIDLGRGSEVRDRLQRLVRANHVAFLEGPAGANQTVSRCHAHIAIDPASGAARVHDDHSSQGTGLVRGGRTIPVPAGSRGVRLRSGDEIVLGEARVRIRIERHESA